MKEMFTYPRHLCEFNMWFIVLLLLLICYNPHVKCHLSNNYRNASISNNNNNNNVSALRFRDFAPRSIMTAAAAKDRLHDSAHSEVVTLAKEYVVNARSARGIHFEADNKDLSVDLEFVIPFLRIPIERSLLMTKTAFRKLVDLNTGTLLLTGVLVVVGAAVAGFVKLLSVQPLPAYGYSKKTRVADATMPLMDAFGFVSYATAENGNVATKSVTKVQHLLGALEAKLQENDVNVSACAQRAICGYVQRAVVGVSAGQGTPVERIVDGLISLDILKSYLQDTALHNAIEWGRKGVADACVITYERCNWSKLQNHAWHVMLEYLKYFTGRNG